MKVSAVIPAAGMGLRMGGNIPKQFLTLSGKPLLHHTLAAFQQCDVVDSVVLVVPEKELKNTREKWLGHPAIVKKVIQGGAQRQDSVRNGFEALGPDTDIVVVHDGVRPFVTPDLIRKSVQTASDFGAVITAVPVNDTLKKADAQGVVECTVSRDHLWRVQTPQAFRYELLREAFEKAGRDGFYGTDEGSLIENLGREVKIIPGSELNIKITRSEDLLLGETIFNQMNGKPRTS